MYITTTRSDLASASAAGFAPPDGAVWAAADLRYLRRAAADIIPDLPGWEPLGDWDIRHFGAVPDAATAEAARNTAIAIQAGYDAAAAAGQPLHIGPGTWQVHMNPDEINNSGVGNRIAPLRFAADSGVVFGAGTDRTVIRCFSGGAYSAIAWQRLPLENGVAKIAGGLYADFTVDGGVEDPSGAPGSGRAAALAAGLDGVSFERVRFCNANQYGFGAQNGGHRCVLMTDCEFRNTGLDGFDIKNNNVTGQPSVGWAFRLIRPRFTDCCRATWPSPGAWCDIMGEGNHVVNPLFTGMGTTGNAQALLRIKQGQDAQNTRGIGGYRNIVEGMQVDYNAASPVLWLANIRAPYCVLTDLRQTGDALAEGVVGVSVWQPHVSIVRPRLKGSGTGIGVSLTPFSGGGASYEFSGADNATVEGGVFTGLAAGILTSRAGLRAHGNAFPGCTTGISGGTGGVITGNDFHDCTTPYALTDNSNRVANNTGDSGFAVRAHGTVGGVSYFDTGHSYRFGLLSPAGNWRERFRIINSTGHEEIDNRLDLVANDSTILLQALGDSANLDLRFLTKGSGRLRFGTHETLGAETVTGYITIKDSGGTLRKLAVLS